MTAAADQSQAKRVEAVLQQLDQLPTLPSVVLRVLEVTGSDSTSASDVVPLIQSDLSLTTKILQLVHRADMGVRGDVTSVDRAVVLLGFEAVRSAALAISVFETMEKCPGKKDGHFERASFWKHSLAVACCAELLAGEIGIPASEAFVCGLLHDLGKVALDAALPKSFDRVIEAADLLRGNIADVERKVIGLDHMVVGKRLAERWNLPAAIRDCIWLHGQLPQALPATVKNPRLVNLVTLADLLVREQHLGYSGNYTFNISTQILMDALGLDGQKLLRAQQQLVEHIEPRAKALGLNESSSSELYQQALAAANRELGRVTGQLAQKNRRLAIRARFFDALSQFQGELRPDAPAQVVLQAIGQTAVQVLGVKCACAFSLMPGQTFADSLLFDHDGSVLESSLIDCPARPVKPVSNDGPVLYCKDDMEWLASAISPRLAGTQRYWIQLEADGACIGGVVWGADAGELQRLSSQFQELSAIANGWALALRTAQIREEARLLSEQLAEANRLLQSAQNEVLRSRMLVSMREMAAGAAHEMNNPLMIISGRAQQLAKDLSDPKFQHYAKQIYEQSHRVTDIITELMAYAKPEPPQRKTCPVAELIHEAVNQAKQRCELADRQVEVSVGNDVPQVAADPQQVGSALRELLENAIQATDTKGQIAISAGFDPYSSKIVLTVSDNGCGMDEKTLKQAFDPFFSSKKAGRRRGMGLAKALRWVEANGGSIRLESRLEKGTRAMMLLPAAVESMQADVQQQRKAL